MKKLGKLTLKELEKSIATISSENQTQINGGFQPINFQTMSDQQVGAALIDAFTAVENNEVDSMDDIIDWSTWTSGTSGMGDNYVSKQFVMGSYSINFYVTKPNDTCSSIIGIDQGCDTYGEDTLGYFDLESNCQERNLVRISVDSEDAWCEVYDQIYN